MSSTSSRPNIVLWVGLGFITIVGVLLFTEHKAHMLGALPYILLIACPLLHIFMHGSHGDDHTNHHNHSKK